MLQNVYAANAPREASAFNFHLAPYGRVRTIIGRPTALQDDDDADVDLQETVKEFNAVSQWLSSSKHSKETVLMPRWLSTMSKDDGVPSWLEPVRSGSSCENFQGTYSSFSS
jgi:hypothetical protein